MRNDLFFLKFFEYLKNDEIYLDELLLKTMLALNRSYLIHLGQHNLLKILKVSSFSHSSFEISCSFLDRYYSLHAKTFGTFNDSSHCQFSFQVNLLVISIRISLRSCRLLLNHDFNRTYLILFSQTILPIPTFISLCQEHVHQVKINQID